MGSLPSEDLPAIYSRWFGAPVLAEAEFRDWHPPAGSEELPLEFLLEHGWLPWERGADGWVFATSSPCDLEVNAWLAESGYGAELRLLALDDFEALKVRLGIENRESQLDGLSLVEEDRLRELASEAPTVNLLNSLTAKALRRGASDMHIEPHGGRARVRFRIDGVLHDIDSIPKAMVLPVITRLKILAGMDIAERRRPQDGKIELRIGGEDVDVRVSALPLREGGESAVLRFLRKAALIYDMGLLGLSPDIEARILEDLRVTSGRRAPDRADRVGQDDQPVYVSQPAQQPGRQDHHARGSRGIPAAGHQPGAGAAGHRLRLRTGPAQYRETGP
jgi:general secretion pathway protein E